MPNINRDELAKKIQTCLREAGVQAQLSTSEHESIVFAQIEQEGGTLRAITQISDREVLPRAHGPVANEIARARLSNVVIRPSLGARSGAKPSDFVVDRPGPQSKKSS